MNKCLARLLVASWTCTVAANSFTVGDVYRASLVRGGGGDSPSKLAASTAATATATDADVAASIWSDLEAGPPDAILGIAQAFKECTAPSKVNICVGAYRDEDGKPWVLPTVAAAEELLLQQQAAGTANKEYLPIEGDSDFVNAAMKFAYGADADLSRVAAVQTLSGTGACRVAGEFFAQHLPGRSIYIPVPTWGNHWKIFGAANLKTAGYRYYDAATNRLDFSGLMEDLKEAESGSIILMHACAHNPTGCDPSQEQWKEIAAVLREKKHICFFDSAYQGFASGDSEQDAWALRYVVSQGDIPVLLAQSFAKNFGLYGERCGTLSVICADAPEKERIISQLRCVIRPMYSSPPRHGSSIVKTVLQDEKLTAQYYTECEHMAHRIAAMRTRLVEELKLAGSTHDWSHVTEQIGMFAFTGMSAAMVDQLTADYHIYLTRDGRISLAGLNDGNAQYVAEAVHAVTDGKSITAE